MLLAGKQARLAGRTEPWSAGDYVGYREPFSAPLQGGPGSEDRIAELERRYQQRRPLFGLIDRKGKRGSDGPGGE